MKHTLFVYGSLMEGFWNYDKSLKGHVRSVAPAYVQGKLYHMPYKGYPALLAGDDKVHGELIEVDNLEVLLPILNDIEQYYGVDDARNEYEHTPMPVYNETGFIIDEVPVYVYRKAIDQKFDSEAIYLADGSWRAYMKKREGE